MNYLSLPMQYVYATQSFMIVNNAMSCVAVLWLSGQRIKCRITVLLSCSVRHCCGPSQCRVWNSALYSCVKVVLWKTY
jgi:hypothetical protein